MIQNSENAAERAVSPGLVLVDPSLAERARSSLPPPSDTVERLEAILRMRPPAVAAHTRLPAPPAPPVPPPALPAAGSRGSSSRRSGSLLLPVGVVAVLLVSLLLGVRVDVGGQRAGADSSTVQPASPNTTTEAETRPKAHASHAGANEARAQKRRASAPTHRRFAWAPTAGASGYDVEFFRGGTRIYVGHTTSPAIDVPARWRYDGAAHSFVGGEYRWYVWPEVGGRRAARASVQTTISIAPS